MKQIFKILIYHILYNKAECTSLYLKNQYNAKKFYKVYGFISKFIHIEIFNNDSCTIQIWLGVALAGKNQNFHWWPTDCKKNMKT